jgi:hypothetical protein
MNVRKSDEQEEKISDYDMIPKPWTAISGVIQRKFEPIVPGSYGYAFQEVLKKTSEKKKKKN